MKNPKDRSYVRKASVTSDEQLSLCVIEIQDKIFNDTWINIISKDYHFFANILKCFLNGNIFWSKDKTRVILKIIHAKA